MFRLLKLEERIVLDGAAVLDALDADQAQDVHDQAIQDAADDAGDAHDADTGIDSQEPLFLDALEAVQEDAGLNVLVVSSDVSDGDDLAAAAKDDVLVVRYDAESTDLDQLADLIAGALDGQKADSIAFAAHSGNDASIYLTDSDVTTAASLDDADQQAFWTAVSGNLADDGRIDLLGCDVVKGDDGEALLSGLEDLTGTNVAASSDATGNDAYGGDWVLESDGVDIAGTYFDADRLEAFDGVLLSGDDPDAGYNQVYDVSVPAGKYWLVKVPRANWTDVGGTGDADADISFSFKYDTDGDGFDDAAPLWLKYVARNDGFLVKKAPVGISVGVQVIAEDNAGNQSPVQTFTISAYDDATLDAPTYADVTGNFAFTEGDAAETVVVPAAGYQIAADTDGTIANYEIVSGNPTDGTNFGFGIDASGNIVIANSSLLIHNEDPYVTDNTYQLVVRAEDNDGLYATSTVEIDILQGAVKTDVTLSVDNPTLSEDPTENDNAATITVNLSVAPTAPVTIDLAYAGTGANPADGSDYTAPASVTFNAGETSATVQLTVANDGVAEGSETFTVDINETTLPANYLDKATPVDMTIVDGKPTVSLSLAPVSFNENGQAVLTANLDAASDQAIIVPLTFSTGTGDALHGDDYTTTQDAVTIAAGATQGTLTLTGVIDNTDEGGSESFTISVTDDAANPFKIDATNGSVAGTINDVVVEKPIASVNVSGALFTEGETISVQISLEHSDGTPYFVEAGTGGLAVEIDLSGSATLGTDYTVPTLITVPEGSSTRTVTLSSNNDADSTEGNETINGEIIASTNYILGTPNVFNLTLQDVVVPVVSLTGDATISEPGDGVTDPTSATVTISRTAATEANTVQLTVAGSPAATEGVDYEATYADGTAVQKAGSGNWIVELGTGVTSETITVQALADGTFEGATAEQIVLTLGTISGSATADGTNNTATIEITDVDTADAPTVNLGVDADGVLPYETSGGLIEDGTGTEAMTAAIYLDSGDLPVAGLPVTVYIEATGDAVYGDDFGIYSDAAGSTEITPTTADDGTTVWALTIDGATTVENFYVVGLGDDNLYEGNETFDLSIHSVENANTGNTAITGTITDATALPDVSLSLDPTTFSELDDDATAGVDESTATLTITIDAGAGDTFAAGVVNVTLTPDETDEADRARLADGDYEAFESDGTTPLVLNDTDQWIVPVTVTEGATSGTATIVLSGIGDEAIENAESVDISADEVDGATITPGTATATLLNSEPPGGALEVALDTFADPTEVGEAAGTTAINVSLNRSSLDDVVVTMHLGGDGVFYDSDSTDDVEERDYKILDSAGTEIDVASDGTFFFTIAAGDTSGSVTLEGIEDVVYEGNESFTAAIDSISGDGTASTNTETGTIVESLAEPTVSLFFLDGTSEVGSTTFSEAGGAQVVAKLDHASEFPVTVNLNYVTGTDGAVLTEDYNGAASITIPAGVLQQTTNLVAIDDLLLESDETFDVQISDADVTNGTADATNNTITGTIADNDAAGAVQVWMEWDSGDSELGEAAGDTATVVVNLDRTTGNPVGVVLEFKPAAISGANLTDDYEVSGATLVEGTTNQYAVTIDGADTTAQVTLTGVANDGILEGDEFFTVDIDSFVGGEVEGNPPVEIGGTQQLTATVKDDTAAPEVWITVDDTTIIEGVEVAKVTAHSTAAALVDIPVYVTLDPGATDTATFGVDYHTTPVSTGAATIIIPAGETASVTPLSIVTDNDTNYEGDETLTVAIDQTTQDGTDFITKTDETTTVTVTLQDDEPKPTVSLTADDPLVTELDETGSANFTLTLSGTVDLASDPGANVIVTLDLGAIGADGAVLDTDYELTIDGGTVTTADVTDGLYAVTFTGGTAGTIPITVTGIDESPVEIDGDKNFRLAIDSVTSTAAATVSTSDDAVFLDVLDDDLPYVNVDVDTTYGGTSNVLSEINVGPNADYEKLDISLVAADGTTPVAVPTGEQAVVAIQFSGDAVFDDDYSVFSDPTFSQSVTVDADNTVLLTIDSGQSEVSLYMSGSGLDNIFEVNELITITAVENTANDLVRVEDIDPDNPGPNELSTTVTIINDDDAPTVTLTQNTATTSLLIDEGDTDAALINYVDFDLTFDTQSQIDTTVFISLTGAQDEDYVVKYSDGTEADVNAGVATLTFGAADLDVSDGAIMTFRVEAVDDALTTPKYEADEQITVAIITDTASPVTYEPDTSTASPIVTIQDDDEDLIPRVILELSDNGDSDDLVLDEAATVTDTETILVKLVDQDDDSIARDIGSDTTITLGFADGAILGVATADTDYTAEFITATGGTVPVTFTGNSALVVVPAGDTEGQLVLTIAADTTDELDETFDVRITGAGELDYNPIPIAGSIVDDDAAPTVTLGAWTNTATIDENGGTSTLTATLTGNASEKQIVVTLGFGGTSTATYTQGGGADDDVTDNLNDSHTLTFAPGATTASVTVYGVSDDKFEVDPAGTPPNETLVAEITGVSTSEDTDGDGTITPGTDDADATIAAGTQALTITDDVNDKPSVSLSLTPDSIYELGGTQNPTATVVTLTLDKASGVDTPVDLVFSSATGEGVDIVVVDDTTTTTGTGAGSWTYSATIPAGETSYTIQVQGADDTAYEEDEVFDIDIDGTVNTAYVTENGTQQETFTLMDGNDAPEITLSAGSTFAEYVAGTPSGTPGTDDFTISLGAATIQEEVIILDFAGTAGQGDDYTIDVGGGAVADSDATLDADGQLAVTLPTGATSAVITLTAVDNTFYENEEYISVTVADPGELLNADTSDEPVNFTITDDDPTAYVKLELVSNDADNPTQMNESGGFANVFAYLVDDTGNAIVAGTDVTVTVAYDPEYDPADPTTIGVGNAIGAIDYSSNDPHLIDSGLVSITIPTGSSQGSAWVSLNALNDTEYEGNETFTVSVDDVVNAEATDTTNHPTSVVGTIMDDEAGPTVTMTVDTTVIAETTGVATLTLSLSEASPVDEVIYVNITDTADDSFSGNWGTLAQSTSDYEIYQVDGAGTTEITGNLDATGDDPATTDVIETLLPVTITAGTQSVDIRLVSVDDDSALFNWLYEKDETFTVSIDDDSFANNLVNDPANVPHTVTIIDDDAAEAPEVSLAWATPGQNVAENAADGSITGSFNVVLSNADSVQSIEVVISYDNVGDYTFNTAGVAGGTATDDGNGTLTITVATGTASVNVPFSVVDDSSFEGEENFNLEITDVKFADPAADDQSLTGTIADDDELTINVAVNTAPTSVTNPLTEGDTDLTENFFLITKTEESSEAIYVDWEISGDATADADYTGATSGQAILAGQAGAQDIISMTILGDNLDELDETVVVTLTGYRVGAADAELVTFSGGTTSATLTIADDDESPVEDVNAGLTVTEGDSGVIYGLTDGTITTGDTGTVLAYSDGDLEEGEDLWYQITDLPDNGTLFLDGTAVEIDGVFSQADIDNGSVTYTHDDSETLSDAFGFTVSDAFPIGAPDDINTEAGTFDITVTPENDAPVKDSIVFWVKEGTTGDALSDSPDLTGNGVIITDQDGDTLTSTLTGDDSGAFALDASTPGELTLTLNTPLDYETQTSYTLVVHAEDADGVAVDTLVVVNVTDDVTDGGYVAGPLGDVDPVTIGDAYVYQIDDAVFPDGAIVTYEATSTSNISWLHFEAETQTFWYVPADDVTDPEAGTYTIQVTATYWDNEGYPAEPKGQIVVDVPIEVTAPVVASLDAEMVNDALNYLESDEAEVLPEAGDALVIQDMMLASAAADYTETAEQTGEYADVLALLEDEQLAWTEDRMVG
ncbi:hypothetical protein DENIS_2654 [Desulfonema ishimotonii]|uniref:Cadherin domain-containing protein n=2 Tax=Desulfonema ishimotonii TaxID=45657 RepID=A0A401FXG0_9BACT|nr:hypothetical protein DENIS_2654 [Desulfonema ishimotonii]